MTIISRRAFMEMGSPSVRRPSGGMLLRHDLRFPGPNAGICILRELHRGILIR